jgi:hypothetical protein
MTTEWRDHLKTFVEKPDLRPYFEHRVELTTDDPKREAVLALADVRLDTIDAILTYAVPTWSDDEIFGWRSTFENAFRSSPVLCARLNETPANYGRIFAVGSLPWGIPPIGGKRFHRAPPLVSVGAAQRLHLAGLVLPFPS